MPASRRSVLHADGGPTRNEFLMQFTADITGVELVVSEVPESSALGAAMAGRVGLGARGHRSVTLQRTLASTRDVSTRR